MKYASPEEEWKEVLKTNATAQRFASTLSQLITYRFDCFTGLPEEWHHHHIGAFAQQPPALDTSHATIIEGLFEDTLPSFISEHQEKVAFLHVDCDLYSSTKTIFDEIKAFDEYVKENGVYYDYVSRAEGCAAACKILFSETAAKAEELRHTKTKINKADEHVL